MNTAFRNELEQLINKHSIENGSNTPDFILADYLLACLDNYNKTISYRESWYGVKLEPTGIITYEIEQDKV